MGIFEPSVNLEKEQKMLAKYNPYDGLTAAVKVTNQNVIIRKTQFRLSLSERPNFGWHKKVWLSSKEIWMIPI